MQLWSVCIDVVGCPPPPPPCVCVQQGNITVTEQHKYTVCVTQLIIENEIALQTQVNVWKQIYKWTEINAITSKQNLHEGWSTYAEVKEKNYYQFHRVWKKTRKLKCDKHPKRFTWTPWQDFLPHINWHIENTSLNELSQIFQCNFDFWSKHNELE